MEQSRTTTPAVETAGLILSQTSLASLSRGEAWSRPRDRSTLHTQPVPFRRGVEMPPGRSFARATGLYERNGDGITPGETDPEGLWADGPPRRADDRRMRPSLYKDFWSPFAAAAAPEFGDDSIAVTVDDPEVAFKYRDHRVGGQSSPGPIECVPVVA